jgi:acetyl esterase/lipase
VSENSVAINDRTIIPMQHDSRLDPEVRKLVAAAAQAAAKLPPLPADPSPEVERERNELLGLPGAAGGPLVAQTSERWIAARGRRIFCRLHRPLDKPGLPVAVYLHGGGWYFSSVDTHDRVAREIAAAGEVAVLSVDYALSPEAKFPQALEECAAVVRHLAAHGADWQLDASRILVCGDSAGGNLALATGLLLRDTAGPKPRGILAAYPVCDSDFTTESYREFAAGLPLTAEKMRFFWNAYVSHAVDMVHPLAAPLRADLSGLPPVLLHVAEVDVLRSEGEAMGRKLEEAGVTIELEVFPGLTHGFMRATGAVARAREAMAKAGAWLRRVTA